MPGQPTSIAPQQGRPLSHHTVGQGVVLLSILLQGGVGKEVSTATDGRHAILTGRPMVLIASSSTILGP